MKPLQLGVFASGRGSNFEAILKAIDENRLNAEVKLLLSNKSDAGALETAEKCDIPVVVLNRKMFDHRDSFINKMISILKSHHVDLIALAGYMKKIPAEVIREFPNRILNIHPALLPAFGGRGSYGHHVHDSVLEYGCKVSGVTVHFVDELYDHGPVIAQRPVPVEDDDTVKTLASRILKVEHQIYPQVLQWFAEGRVHVKLNKVIVDKQSKTRRTDSMTKRAILSVSDKTGIVDFARELKKLGFELVSTGGTARLLAENGLSVIPVDSVTEFPEMMDGRVKTLHPRIHGGILGLRDNEEHAAQAEANGIQWIDLLVVNLYPFEKTIANPDVTIEEAIENIDIGGPAMLRSAAKNYRFVTIITDPDDYAPVLDNLKNNGDVPLILRQKLASKVFKRTADYDSAIDQFLSKRFSEEEVIRLTYRKGELLRYGENSHQSARFCIDPACDESSAAHAELLHGKAMSYNNYVDADAAWEAVKELDEGFGVSVIKHTNPCGYATGSTAREALERAWQGDPISAFGSVIACNKTVDRDFASFLKGKDEKHISYMISEEKLIPQEVPAKFVEVIIAPDFTDDALEMLMKVKALRLLKTKPVDTDAVEKNTYRKITGGMLEMSRDLSLMQKLEIVTEKNMNAEKQKLAVFTYKACKHTKSNAIVLARMYKSGQYQVIGMGAGQPNRVDSLRKLAVTKAVENLQIEYDQMNLSERFEVYLMKQMNQMMMASEAFFPFDDTVRAAAESGIRYIIQPGGSKRDEDSVNACNELGVAMAFTGMRHFKH